MNKRSTGRRKADQLADRLRRTERVLLFLTGVAIGAMLVNLKILWG